MLIFSGETHTIFNLQVDLRSYFDNDFQDLNKRLNKIVFVSYDVGHG